MISTIALLLVLVATALLYIHRMYYTYDRKFLSLVEKIPGPRWLPFIGAAYSFDLDPNKMLSNVMAICKKYYPVAGIWIGPEFYAFVSGTKDIEVILNAKTKSDKTCHINEIMKSCMGEGLITSDGERWKKHRKLMNPMFYSDTLKVLVSVFDAKVRSICDLLESEVGKPHFDVIPYLEKCGIRIMIATTATEEYETAHLSDTEIILESINKIRVGIVNRFIKPWLYPDFVYNNLQCGKEINASIDYLFKTLRKMASNTKQDLQSKIPTENGVKFTGSFLEYMFQLQKDPANELTDEDVIGEMSNLLSAAFETSTASIGLTIFVLSRHTDIQEKIVEEIRQEFGSLEDKPITYENITRLKYLDRVVKESLRVYSPVTYVIRHLLEDVKLPSGYELPGGSNVIAVLYKMHQNPEMFPNPEKFDPDNFLPEKVAARPPFAFAPFGLGPRNCIGQKYAVLSIKTQIISILRRFKIIATNFEPELVASIGLTSSNGINIGIKRRCDT